MGHRKREHKQLTKRIVCSQCDGERYVEHGWGWPWSYAVDGLAHKAGYAWKDECPRCGGSGMEPEGLKPYKNPLLQGEGE